MPKTYKNKKVLEKLYVEQNLTVKEVAEELDCSGDTVSRWLNKHNINTGRLTNEQRQNISLSDEQRQIIKGLLMGDGCITRRNSNSINPTFRITMANEKFINWLYEKLKPIASGVVRRKGKYADTLENTQYTVNTYSHKLFSNFANWYVNGQKRWPLSEEFTELELKMLYVTDGSIVNENVESPSIKISAINESDRRSQVLEMFERDFGIEINWHKSSKHVRGNIYIPSEYCNIMWEQNAPPGFKYKWPKEYR